MVPFDMIDTNKDGVITRKEFEKAESAYLRAPGSNNANSTNQAEFERAQFQLTQPSRSVVHQPSTRESAVEFDSRAASSNKFDMMDVNRDGFITRKEFERSHLAQMVPFDMIDTNRDGLITRKEFEMAEERAQCQLTQPSRSVVLQPSERESAVEFDGVMSQWQNQFENDRRLFAAAVNRANVDTTAVQGTSTSQPAGASSAVQVGHRDWFLAQLSSA